MKKSQLAGVLLFTIGTITGFAQKTEEKEKKDDKCECEKIELVAGKAPATGTFKGDPSPTSSNHQR